MSNKTIQIKATLTEEEMKKYHEVKDGLYLSNSSIFKLGLRLAHQKNIKGNENDK